jgi:hypothetical protein
MIVVFCCGAVIYAIYKDNLAAGYIAGAAFAILYLLHAIEFKLNKLLDYHRIFVSDGDIARD